MASHTVNGSPIPHGLNQSNLRMHRAVTEQVLANGEILSVQIPLDWDYVPVGMICYAKAGDVYTRDADIGVITDHDKSTGITRITAAGAVAAGSLVYLQYLPA